MSVVELEPRPVQPTFCARMRELPVIAVIAPTPRAVGTTCYARPNDGKVVDALHRL